MRGVFVQAVLLSVGLWVAARPASAQVACSSGSGLLGGSTLDDMFGSYSYFGGGAFDGQPAIEVSSGTGHHEALGTEVSAAISARGMLLALTLRTPLVRAGLSAPWTSGGQSPSLSFLLTPRYGLAFIAPATRSFGAWVGIDAEWLVVGQLLVAVRSGLFLPFDRRAVFVRPIPMVTLSIGFGPAGAYGWNEN